MYSLRVGDRVAVRCASLDVVAAWCAAFGIRSHNGRCDEPIFLLRGTRVIARSNAGWTAMRREIDRLTNNDSFIL